MPGFLAVHQPTRFFIQTRDLKNVMDNWQEMDEFQEFIAGFDNSNGEYTKEELVNSFLNLANNKHNKHFEQWQDKFYFALATDELPATYLAKWLLGEQVTIDPSLTCVSQIHNTTIDVSNLIFFLTSNKNVRTIIHQNGLF